MTLACRAIEAVYTRYDAECIITSGNDGVHKEDSKHYSGEALDFRTKNLARLWDSLETNNERKRALAQEIAETLQGEFDVILESLGGTNEHLHVEYDPA